MILAREITTLYAGAEAAVEAELRFKSVFQQNQIPDDAPIVLVDSCDGVSDGNQLVTALVRDGYYGSKSQIRRIFQQGGATWDNERVTAISLGCVSDVLIMRFHSNGSNPEVLARLWKREA